MKKSIAMVLISTILIITSVFIPEVVETSLPVIETTTLQKSTLTNYVTGNGQVENRSRVEVTYNIPIIVNEVFVGIGDDVEKGQELVSIDKDKTVQKLYELSGTKVGIAANFATGSSFSSIEESEKMIKQIPEVITASQSGTIGTVNIISGDFVLPDTTMMSIIRSEDLEVKVAVNESKIAKVKEGQPATITGIAFDGHEYTGRVKQIYPEARKQYIGTTQETVVDVVISLDNPDNHIKTGFTAKAQIETEKPKKLRVLPHEVISQDDEGEFVYAYSGGVAIRRNVVTGEEFSGGTEILSGINDNELIISCPSKIKGDGDYVRAKAH